MDIKLGDNQQNVVERLSICNDCPNLMGTAIDISKKALKVAKINAKMHQLLNRIKYANFLNLI